MFLSFYPETPKMGFSGAHSQGCYEAFESYSNILCLPSCGSAFVVVRWFVQLVLLSHWIAGVLPWLRYAGFRVVSTVVETGYHVDPGRLL